MIEYQSYFNSALAIKIIEDWIHEIEGSNQYLNENEIGHRFVLDMVPLLKGRAQELKELKATPQVPNPADAPKK